MHYSMMLKSYKSKFAYFITFMHYSKIQNLVDTQYHSITISLNLQNNTKIANLEVKYYTIY